MVAGFGVTNGSSGDLDFLIQFFKSCSSFVMSGVAWPRGWAKTASIITISGAAGFILGHYVLKPRNVRVNRMIRLDEKQARDTVYIDDIEDKISLCRCWKSETFPLCDGCHKEHNKLCGDNTGPVVIRRYKEPKNNK